MRRWWVRTGTNIVPGDFFSFFHRKKLAISTMDQCPLISRCWSHTPTSSSTFRVAGSNSNRSATRRVGSILSHARARSARRHSIVGSPGAQVTSALELRVPLLDFQESLAFTVNCIVNVFVLCLGVGRVSLHTVQHFISEVLT
jgi:hypothetical protein